MDNKYGKLIITMILLALSLTGCSSPVTTLPEGSSLLEISEETIDEEDVVEAYTETHGDLTVTYIDVGQGDSIHIHTPEGQDILIDAGEKKYGADVVNHLKSVGVEELDAVIVTHPHSDHIGGIPVVMDSFPVKKFYAPKVTHTTKTFENMVLSVKEQGLQLTEAKIGVALDLVGIKASFIGPVGSDYKNLNDWSASLKVVYGDTSFVFTGDAEKAAENDMVATGQELSATVLKLGHHGSDTSSTDAFLDAVNPKYAIAMVGEGNKYNHPNDSTLQKMEDRGVKLYRTDLNGTIVAKSDGQTVTFNGITDLAEDETVIQIEPEEITIPQETTTLQIKASLNDNTPTQNTKVTLTVEGDGALSYVATVHYKSKDTILEGIVGEPLEFGIGRAAVGHEVLIDVQVGSNITHTSFTPRAK